MYMASHIFVWVLSQPFSDSARKRENQDMRQRSGHLDGSYTTLVNDEFRREVFSFS